MTLLLAGSDAFIDVGAVVCIGRHRAREGTGQASLQQPVSWRQLGYWIFPARGSGFICCLPRVFAIKTGSSFPKPAQFSLQYQISATALSGSWLSK